VSGDTVGHLLQQLSTPQIHHVLTSFDAQRFPQDAAVLDGLLRTAGSAAAHHDVPRALAALTEYVNRNPEHASTLSASLPLRPIQGEVLQLVHQITMDAKADAVRLITKASDAVDAAAKHLEKLDSGGVLAVAERLVETGQLANYFRASELSQAVIAFYARPVPEVAFDSDRGAKRGKPDSEKIGLVSRLWGRVPLLVLLGGWLVLGAAGVTIMLLARAVGVELLSLSTTQAAFEFWGVGFLALVILQFWITVRGIL
jgi:hypothetical protein